MRVALRVDAGPAMGIGHAMRSFTLGAELRRRGHEVCVQTVEMPDGLAAQMAASGLDVVDASDGLVGAFDVIVYDGYHLGPELCQESSARIVVAIDDNRELPLAGCALVINQNLHATPEMYADLDTTRTLIGPSYALLRQGVLDLAEREVSPTVGTVLLSLGGSDPAGLTAPLLDWLLDNSELRVIVAAGPAHPERDELVATARHFGNRVTVDRGDLHDGLSSADLAVIGGGTTMYEVGRLGVPAIAAIVADNQVDGTHAAEARGFVTAIDVRAMPPGDDRAVETITAAMMSLVADADLRRSMSAAGRGVFDGRGAERVAVEIERVAT